MNILKKKKEFSFTTRALIIFGVVAGLALIIFSLRVFGDATVALTLTTNPDLERGLVGHWTFDGKDIDWGTEFSIRDRSGQGNHGTTTVATSTGTIAGKIGQALNFNAIDGYVSINIIDDTIGNAFTECLWIFPRVLPSESVDDFQDIVDKQESWDFFFRKSTSNLEWKLPTDNDNRVTVSESELAKNNWNHICGRYDGSTKKLYLNGVEKGSVVGTGNVVDKANTFIIGRDSASGFFFDGLIDDVRIYNRALSKDEIKRLYDLGATTKINVTLTTNPDLERGLIAHWTFDGKDINIAANQIIDRTGNGHTGTTTGMDTSTTTVAGKIGQALDFDGVDDEINIDSVQSTLAGLSQVTISAWIKIRSYGISGTAFIRQIVGDDESSFNGTINFRIGTDGTDANKDKAYAHMIMDGSGDQRDSVSGTTVLSLDTWYHLTFSWQQNGRKVLYVDGIQEVNSAAGSNTIDTNASSTLFIGDDEERSRNWDGAIDDVRIYNRALSAEEVKRLYQLGATTKINTTITTNPDLENGLVGHWTFDGKDINIATNVITDRSGNDNNGTTVGMDTSTTTAFGKIGQALDFDGVDDYVDMGSDSSIDNVFTGGGTLVAWIKPDGSGESVFPRIFNKRVESGDFDGWSFIIKHNSGSPQLSLGHTFTGDDSDWETDSNSIIYTQWQHVAVVYNKDSASNLPVFYINGVVSATTEVTAPTGTAESDAAENLLIGERSDLNRAFDGSIDDARIYNRALSAEEISRLYDLGR